MTIPDDAAGPLAEAAKELLPKVYEDGVQSSLQEIGHTLAGVVRTVLRPVNALVWSVDQASEWVERRVTERLTTRGLTADELSSPSPQILYGVIRGVQATGSEADHNLREMYVNLLATAMASETATNAHPAFADLLMQMLPDEARVIRLLAGRGGTALVALSLDAWYRNHRSTTSHQELFVRFEREVESLAQEAECLKESAIESYLDNLKRLGLVEEEAFKWERHRTDFPPPPLPRREAGALLGVMGYDFPPVASVMKEFLEFRNHAGTSWIINTRQIHLTAFGEQFVGACVE